MSQSVERFHDIKTMNLPFVNETEYIDKVIFEYQIIPEFLASWGHRVFVFDFLTQRSKDTEKPLVITQLETIEGVSRTKGRVPSP